MEQRTPWSWHPADILDAMAARLRPPGVTAGSALVALAAILVLANLLGRSKGDEDVAALASHVAERGADPAALVAGAVRAHRFVFLSDIDGAPEPKRIAARAIETAATEAGLDVVALEVPESEQPYIDAYLRSDPEDVGILMRRPAALRRHAGTEREYLEIYRTVWRLNRDFDALRRIRIVALDLPDWPPARAVAPATLARGLAHRTAHMVERVETAVLGPNPRARVLLFLDGYHGLRYGRGLMEVGGGGTMELEWLAKALRERYPGDVYTILVDGVRGGRAGPGAYTGTRAGPVLRRALGRRAVAVRVDERFDFLAEPLYENGGPGIRLDLRPRGYRLGDVADAYIYAGGR